MKERFIWGLVVLAAWMSGCSSPNVYMDNDSNQTVVVAVDELSFKMPPRSFHELKLDAGRHQLIVKDSANKVLDETTFTVIEGGLLNIGKSDYYIWTDLYGDAALDSLKLKEDFLEIGEVSLFGDFQKVDPSLYYVEKTWDYGLGEEFPEDLLGWNISKDRWIIKRKIFRAQDLIKAYYQLSKTTPPPAAPKP
ncbi:MAG: hypothetical protein SF053_14095 [Bacteroidia bacterium]|nr:hypothetical protein [Bacteroidia bacterium]